MIKKYVEEAGTENVKELYIKAYAAT